MFLMNYIYIYTYIHIYTYCLDCYMVYLWWYTNCCLYLRYSVYLHIWYTPTGCIAILGSQWNQVISVVELRRNRPLDWGAAPGRSCWKVTWMVFECGPPGCYRLLDKRWWTPLIVLICFNCRKEDLHFLELWYLCVFPWSNWYTNIASH